MLGISSSNLNFVMDRVDHDPSEEIIMINLDTSILRELEIFSERRFEELKKILKEYRQVDIKKKEGHFYQHKDKIQKKGGDRKYQLNHVGIRYNPVHIENNSRKDWWEEENWDYLHTIDDPWGDLSREEEYLLKTLIRGDM